MPKVYGTPTGPAAPASGAQRNVARPASSEEIHRRLDAYEQHLNMERARIEHVRKVVPRGSSSDAGPKRGGASLRVEKALKDAGA